MPNTLLSRKGSGKLLSVLIKSPKRKFSINELSKEAGVPFGTAWNVLHEWERFRVVQMERVGRTNAVSLGYGPQLEAVKKLLELGASPQRAALQGIASELERKGIRMAFLFGSVAQGKERAESDIDIAILGKRGFDTAKESIALLEKLAAKVMFTEFRSEKELLEFLSGKAHERIV